MVDKEKSLAYKFPELAKEWHPTKNGLLSPEEVTPGMGKLVWWKGHCGHEWDDTILHRSQGRSCPYCSNHRILLGYNNLFATNPELEKEWDYDKNTGINPQKISNGSHEKVWWKCSKGHAFQSIIRERVKGAGCPICNNKKILKGFNDLATTHPILAQEWNYEKNLNLTPSQIGAGSSKKVWWKCYNGHEWEATISHRKNGNGCPYCSNRKVFQGYNDLSSVHPDIALQWNYERNGTLSPHDVTPACNKKIWWICEKGHEWEATVLNRHQGNNCPICANQQVLIGYNDLLTIHPYLSKEWNYEKNGELKPTDVVAGSNQKVWWIGNCGHEWQASVGSRSSGRGCPICANSSRISFPEKCVFYYLKKAFEDAQENVRLPELNKLEIDIYIPSIRVGVEYDGAYWHPDLEKDIQKDFICNKNGITLYRIREYGCEVFDKDTWLQLPNNGINALEKIIELLIMRLSDTKQTENVDIERDRLLIYDAMEISAKERSIENLFPELAKQWHPTKNGKLTPKQFSIFSRKKVWWLGKCGHEWDASVHARTSGSDCPYCSNKRLLKGFNDLATTHPQLLQEWNYQKNTIVPNEIFAGSEILVWWKCDRGHEWQAFPYKRKSGEKCPYCSNHRVLFGFNDLTTVNPALAEEWDYEQNSISLCDIVAGSNKIVWWKCRVCGYKWKTSVAARNNGQGCKKCANTQLGAKLSKIKLSHNGSLFDHHPELVEEWDYTKNVGITPQTITAHNNTKVWWKCKVCGYEWEATINNRSKNHGCPSCAKLRIQAQKRQTELQQRGSLLQNNPELVAEWDYEKNEISPADIFSNSSTKVWWICTRGHHYQASPNNRNHGRNCPYCSNRKVLSGFNDLATKKPELLLDWDYSKNIGIEPTQITLGNDLKVWWKCSSCGHEWQARIGNRSRGNGCPICQGKKKSFHENYNN